MNIATPATITNLRGLALYLLRRNCSSKEKATEFLGDGSHQDILARLKSDPHDDDRKLVRLCSQFGLSDGELLAGAICLAVENDPHAARLVAAAQEPIGTSRPLCGFLSIIFHEFDLTPIGLASGIGKEIGLFQLADEAAPLSERSIYIPLPIIAAFNGYSLPPVGISLIDPVSMAIPPSLAAAADQRAVLLSKSKDASALAIRSACHREAIGLAQLVARSCGKTCVNMGSETPAAHSCWLNVSGHIPLLVKTLGPGEQWQIDPPGRYSGPVLLVTGSEGVLESTMPVSEWRVPLPEEAERATLWRQGGLPKGTAQRAARNYRQGAGRIAELSERYRLDRFGQKTKKTPWAGLRAATETAPTQLDGLARRSSINIRREDLIIPSELGDQLDLILERIHLRDSLANGLGGASKARYRPGVRALFTGDSGTGKTLAAHWLAQQTGLPLYRVDLAAMTSKWIGETEKNLSAVLDAAQHADVVLFFDEADTLFGARTDVSDSHDRFANAQTNYLLQRIEDFEGVALLATNSRDRFDPAFVRRLDAILEFPLPDAAARRSLWQAHLGKSHDLSEQDINLLSIEIDLAGGHVRNIVLSAAVRARSKKRHLNLTDIRLGAHEEYMKLGRGPPPLRPC